MLYFFELLIGILVFAAGSCIFSFLNVVIYRVPRHLSFVKGRSMCTSCGHALSFLDMVPVFSWLFLGRKCRYCKEPISGRYAVVELLGGGCALLSVYRYSFTWEALFVFAFFALLTVVAFVDGDTMEIPNGFVLAILILALVHLPFTGSFPWVSHLIGFLAVSLPLFLITLVIPDAFGGGDIKLMAACGLFLGWKMILLSFFLAVLGGGGYGIYLLLAHKKDKKEHFSFGPFLCVGMFLGTLWGTQLLNWYFSFFNMPL